MSTKPERIAELDVLRGFAAVAVMLFHYTIRWFEQPGPAVNPLGEFAVHLFFMISGFVIFMTLKNTRTGADFIVSRASRLYPPYWAAVLITACFMVVMPPFEKSMVTLPQVLVNLTMLQQWLRVREVDGVYWTLAVELAFYGWMFVIFKLRSLERIEKVALVWMLVELAARIAERAIVINRVSALDPNYIPQVTNPGIIPKVVSTTFLLEYAHLFFAGILFYRIRESGTTVKRAAFLCVCLFTHWFVHGSYALTFFALFCGIFYLLATRRLAWIAFRPLVFLGGISYSLYLVHQNIGYAVMRKMPDQIQGVQVAAAVGVSLTIAILLSYLIEKPSLRYLRRKWAAHTMK